MQSGKILPTFRQIFATALSTKSTDRDAQSNNQNSGGDQKREPSKDEVLEALEILNLQDEFIQNGLKAVAQFSESKHFIIVKDKKGASLRTLKGSEVIRVLELAKFDKKAARLGRILDRRI